MLKKYFCDMLTLFEKFLNRQHLVVLVNAPVHMCV